MNDCLAIQDKKEETFLYFSPGTKCFCGGSTYRNKSKPYVSIYKWNKKALTRTGGPNSKYY